MTQGSTLGDLIGAALKDGWASTTMLRWSEGQIERQVLMFGYSLAPTRDRQFKVEVLRPTERADAHPNSLSARYGTGQQPLHTDGAHRDEPPEIVLLSAQEPSTVPTLLWRFPTRIPTRTFTTSERAVHCSKRHAILPRSCCRGTRRAPGRQVRPRVHEPSRWPSTTSGDIHRGGVHERDAPRVGHAQHRAGDQQPASAACPWRCHW